MLAADQPAGRRTGAKTVDRLLGRRHDLRMARQAQVIVAGIADDRPSADGRVGRLHLLVDPEEWILQSRGHPQLQPLFERHAFGKLAHVVCGGRNLPIGRDLHFASGLALARP